MAGAIFETAVLAEILKTYLARGEDPQLWFWRTSTGTEVDLIVESETKLVPIEIKTTSTPLPAMASGVEAFARDYSRKAAPGFVVHMGDTRLPLGRSAMALPFNAL